MNSCIAEILDILKAEKINSPKDLVKYEDSIQGRVGIDRVNTNYWVMEVYKLVDKLLQEQKKVLSNQQKYIVSNKDKEEYLKYMCLFPSSSVVITERFEDGWPPSGNYEDYIIPKDFLIKLLSNKELLLNDVFVLLPESIHHKEDDGAGTGMYDVDTLSGMYRIGINSPPKNLLGENGVYITDENVEKLYTSFSWLYGAKVDDYLDLIEKHRLLFDNYRQTIIDYMDNIYTGDFKQFKKDLDEADINIRIAMEKKKAELWAKGRKTVVSAGLVTIPFIPGIPADIKAELLSIIGVGAGTSILELYSAIETGMSMKSVGMENPFWFAWKWKKTVDTHRSINDKHKKN